MNSNKATRLRRSVPATAWFSGIVLLAAATVQAQPPTVIPPGAAVSSGTANAAPATPYYKVVGAGDHLRMTVNTSRFLVMDKKIPQVQVNNPDILEVVPISPNQVQICAKRTGLTQVNLWGEDKRIYTVDVLVVGDASELTQILREQFPKTSLSIVPVGSAVMISGYVDQQDAVPKIVAIAEQFYPRVINYMTVSGVQQVLLHVKVIEISRTKLRRLGFDFSNVTNGNIVQSGIAGLISTTVDSSGLTTVTAPDNLFKFRFVGGSTAFFGVLDALREDKLSKILSEPDLVTISGRPAYVLVGGKIGYQTNSVITGTVVGFQEYGTRLDFVPVVLGNGRIHLDVRPSVSQIDGANSVNGIPALKTRETETGVEMRAGQTLAIAGLLEQRIEATNHGFPLLSEIPYIGAAFRRVQEDTNEVELLVMVTPQIVDGMEPGQVPTCLPGMQTTSPSDWELFFKGHLEVPNCCPADGMACENCANGGPDAIPSPPGGPLARQNPQNRSQPTQVAANRGVPEPGFIGPIGYDVLK